MPNAALIKLTLSTYSAYRLSEWNQAGRHDVAGGVCKGMCLDWMRRILQNKHGGLGTPGHWHSAFGDKKRFERRFSKQKQTHAAYYAVRDGMTDRISEVRRPGFEDIENNRTPAMRGALARINALLPAHLQIVSIDELATLKARRRPTDILDGQKLVQALNDYRDVMGKEIRLNNKMSTMLLEAEMLAAFAVEWKAKVKKQGKAPLIGKNSFSKPVERTVNFDKFGVDTTPPVTRDGGMNGAWLWDMYVNPNLGNIVGKGAILGVSYVSNGDNGHDVAFYLSKDGETAFYFDPNFGEFCFPFPSSAMKGCFSALWDAAYGDNPFDCASWTAFALT